MNEFLGQIITYLREVWRFRWYIHLVAWPLCVAGWVFVHNLPDQYESSAKVYVDTDSVLRPLLKGLAVNTDINQQVKLMTKTLLSRSNLLKVARMTDMDLNIKSPQEEDILYQKLSEKIKLVGTPRDSLYTIGYANESPHLAKDVVQSLVTIFVESSLGGTRKDTNSAQLFIDSQIQEYESKLRLAEDTLKEFKRKNIGLMPTDGRDYYQRLQESMTALEQAKLQLDIELKKKNELLRQQSGEEPTFGIVSDRSQAKKNFSSSVDKRIFELQNRLDSLLLNFTNNHPDVNSLKRKLEQLEIVREKELAEKRRLAEIAAATKFSDDINSNPVYQRMKMALSEVEANIVGLQVKVKDYSGRVNKLKSMVNTIPQVEAEFAQLNRDYEVNRKNYEILISRRESAKISEKAEQNADTIKFQVIEPPRVPITPAAPNRVLLSTVVMILGLAVGCAFAFFLSQIKPTYHDRKTIVGNLGATFLGSVSMIRTSKQRLIRKLEVLSFGVVFFGLFAIYTAYVGLLKFAPNWL